MRRAGVGASVLLLAVAFTGYGVPSARAAETVTYEVISNSIGIADIEYVDQDGRRLITSIPLPWRIDVPIADAEGPTGQGAQVRADWRRIRAPYKWVTVRISQAGRALCESTLDVGNVTCYGNTPHFS
ncbi:hypothetical protein B1790_05820 [Mycobacterium sp. AT1]|nr:hypothetical protein B1790_05820 [Mycobacterium sp. AT1]